MNFNQFEVLTFDCYGTLIDWESGILSALKELVTANQKQLSDDKLLELFAQFESEAESGPYIKYREVLKQVVVKIGDKLDFTPTETELNSLGESLKNWQPFPDTVPALKALKPKYKLGIISNIDEDLFAESAKHLQVEFDYLITAETAKSYKPSLNNFQVALQEIGAKKEKILHVAQSIYHDVNTAKSLGLSTVWVNRRQGKEGSGATLPANSTPDLEVPNLKSLVSQINGQ
jgi:2-haloacid dehalogenase